MPLALPLADGEGRREGWRTAGASGKPEAVTTGTWTRDELWVPSQRPHEDRFFWGKEKKKKERERKEKKKSAECAVL